MRNLNDFISDFEEELNRQCSAYDSDAVIRFKKLNTKIVVSSVLYFLMNNSGNYKLLSTLQNLQLPFLKDKLPSFSASSFCEKRQKVDSSIFFGLCLWVYNYVSRSHRAGLWFGMTIFGSDSTEITLPKELEEEGFEDMNNRGAYYPSGLLTTVFDLRLGLVQNAVFTPHKDERRNLMTLFKDMPSNSCVVSDRGLFGFDVIYEAIKNGVNVLFRIAPAFAPLEIREAIEEGKKDVFVTITPSSTTEAKSVSRGYLPIPLEVRLITATIKGEIYYLITTKLDRQITRKNWLDLYRSRWDIEESYKFLKVILKIEKFKAKKLNTVKQEIFGTLFLANLCQALIVMKTGPKSKVPKRSNYSMTTIAYIVKETFLKIIYEGWRRLKPIIEAFEQGIRLAKTKFRDNRSFPRESHQKSRPWTPS